MNEQEKKFYNSKESIEFNKVNRQWQETGIRPEYYDDVMDRAIEKAKSLGLTKIWDLNI